MQLGTTRQQSKIHLLRYRTEMEFVTGIFRIYFLVFSYHLYHCKKSTFLMLSTKSSDINFQAANISESSDSVNVSTFSQCAVYSHRNDFRAFVFNFNDKTCQLFHQYNATYQSPDNVFLRSTLCHDLPNGILSAVYTITIGPHQGTPVFCEVDIDGGKWTVIQNRFNGEEDFYRTWAEYKNGFGNLYGEYWLGNDLIHLLTSTQQYELRIEMVDASNTHKYASYSSFSISSENDGYRLTVGGFSGDTSDRLSYHTGARFSTKDVDNDENGGQCAVSYKGAWWYRSCYNSNLNGPYRPSNNSDVYSMSWPLFTPSSSGYTAIKMSKMMIRPVR